MRAEHNNFSQQHEKLSNSKKDVSFAYIYEIYLFSGEVLYLYSSSSEIVINDKIFFPFSGINLVTGEFNDSAENIIILGGIFDAKAVTKEMNLAGCQIKIYCYVDAVLNPLVTYFVTEFRKNDLDFSLKCEPETTKYNQSLLLLFSKTCRANFGDIKCGINVNQYKKSYKVKSIKSQIITILDMDFNRGYYNMGQALFLNNIGRTISFRIISHYNDQIIVEEEVYDDLLKQEEVSLATTCNKKFRTCCNKFNNAVNFRGEPTIAEHNLLKNHVR